MNRIILASVSAIALLTGSAALADNSNSSINQISGGSVTVNQSGPIGSTSSVTTEADANLGPNTVSVTQADNGTANTGPGQANVSTVIQDNVNLGTTATVNQAHNAGGYGQNSSYIRQGRNASNGDVTVRQTGGENTSTYVSTTSTDNIGDVAQSGVRNSSYVQQDFQNGAQAYVNQIGNGGPNSVSIQQLSAGFSANPPEFAAGSFAQATQSGDNLTSNILQTGYTDPAAEGNFARSNQAGNDQFSSISQSGINGSADVYQSGAGHDSIVSQAGDGNTALVVQQDSTNYSSITQDGTNDYAEVRQSNNSNESTVSQGSGANNTAYVTQASLNNASTVTQNGSNAFASVTQN